MSSEVITESEESPDKLKQEINQLKQEIKDSYSKTRKEEKVILKPLEKKIKEDLGDKPLEFIEEERRLEIKEKLPAIEELNLPKIRYEEKVIIPELKDLKRNKRLERKVETNLRREIDELNREKLVIESRFGSEISELRKSENSLKERLEVIESNSRSREAEFEEERSSLEKERLALLREIEDIKKDKERVERKFKSKIGSITEIKNIPQTLLTKQISKFEEKPSTEEISLEKIEEIPHLEREIEIPKIEISRKHIREIELCAIELQKVKQEISKIVVGQEKVINSLLKALLSNGHVLVEGVPGIAKTLIIRALAEVTGCKFKRIQFTVDLLPTDIVGFISYSKQKGFYTVKGPVFTNYVIADEINRATPKSQSALLEAMQEREVTIGRNTLALPKPFFVMANKNPIESSGVYPLPEAQRDRFLFQVYVDYPSEAEEKFILKQNITLRNFDSFKLKAVINPARLNRMQELTKEIYLDPEIENYIIDITNATRKPKKYGIELGKYIDYGASPRASIGMFIASKADALLEGKPYVSPQNVKNVAYEVLRHRILLNYEAVAEKITEDKIIDEILSKVPVP